MAAKVKKINSTKSSLLRERTMSRNGMNKGLFLSRLALLYMKRKEFVKKMRALGFNTWTMATLYNVTNDNRCVHIYEAQAICSILGVEVKDLFPALAPNGEKVGEKVYG